MKNIAKLIRESKKLLPHANYEQKQLILKMLEAAKHKLEKNKKTTNLSLMEESDYLQEK